MKKFFKALAIIVSLAILGGAFVSCSDDDDDDEPTKYTVSFETNGGSAVEKQTVEKGKKVTKPTDPTKDGNIFSGWFKESELTTAWDFDSDTVTKNITLYAKWEEELDENEVLVTFVKNHDDALITTTTQKITKETGTALTSAETLGLSRTGYTFSGWNTKADGSGDSYTDEQIVSLTENLTLYAKWTVNKHTVSYAKGTHDEAEVTLAEGSTLPETQEIEYGATVTVGAAISATGDLIFKGWNNGSETYQPNATFTMPDEAVTLTAVWALADEVTVTFHASKPDTASEENSVSGTMSPQTIKKNTATALSANAFSLKGYTFAGWATSESGTVNTADNAQVTLESDTDYYAV